ncbi:MAG: anaerobic ribonucleoside-triphosphate reductase activating protein [Clostridia bacterium]|nr:anaerobic ribonucleoside-triphosphate reductase activating protein [Clostridia bacterium]
MRIGGLVKTSFVDYPGRICTVIFTQGCNLRCPYCHNPQLIGSGGDMQLLALPAVLEQLDKRRGVIDAVTVSGGEPTLQSGLRAFLRQLKLRGFSVKLDTNGTNPQMLVALISQGLVDFFAMDLKAPLAKYAQICGVEQMDLEAVRISARLIRNSGVDYEFRTTFCAELADDDILALLDDFAVSDHYVLQNCLDAGGRAPRRKRDISALLQRLPQGCGNRGF